MRAHALKKRRSKGDYTGMSQEEKKTFQREMEVKIFRREMFRCAARHTPGSGSSSWTCSGTLLGIHRNCTGEMFRCGARRGPAG